MELRRSWTLVGVVSLLLVLLQCIATSRADSCSSLGIQLTENTFATDKTSGPVFEYTSSAVLMLTGNGFYKSYDNGQSWEDQLPFLANSTVVYPSYETSGVRALVSPSSDRDTIYVVGYGPIWVTKNGGKTYTLIAYFAYDFAALNLADIQVSPSETSTISVIAKPTNSGLRSIYISVNYGLDWALLDSNIQWSLWAPALSSRSLVYTQCPYGQGDLYSCRLIRAADNGDSQTSVLNHAAMASANGYQIVVAQYTNSSMQELTLYVSNDLNVWTPLKFPVPIKTRTWKIWPVDSPNTTWITIDTTGVTGAVSADLYINSGHQNMMALSLRNVLPYRVNIVRQSNTSIAYVTTYNGNPSTTTPKVTMMSYDRGGTWNRVPGPDCDPSPCYLNIDDTSPTRKILAGAPGVMIADGNVGASFSVAYTQTFASTDFGNSWKMVHDYPSEFAFSGGGSLAVWARNDQATRQLTFSFALGVPNPVTCDFTDSPFIVGDVLAGDDDDKFDETSVLIWGKRYTNGLPTLVLISVDFTDYPVNQCQLPESPDDVASDYETVSADDAVNGKCILGQKIIYERKRVDRVCFDAHKYNTTYSIKRCPCTEEDYECDYCYERNSEGKCVLQEGCSKLSLKGICTFGYVLVPGDVCDDDTGLNRIPNCSSAAGIVVGVLFAVIVLIGLIVLYRRNDRFREFVKSFGRFGRGLSLDVNFPPRYSQLSNQDEDSEADDGKLFDEEDLEDVSPAAHRG